MLVISINRWLFVDLLEDLEKFEFDATRQHALVSEPRVFIFLESSFLNKNIKV